MTDQITNTEQRNADAGLISADMAVCMDKFSRTFEVSARRWELIVYPSLLAFIILAAYGFYLIYTLTGDVNRLARSMETVVVAINHMSTDLNTVSASVEHISGNLSTIATDVGTGSQDMGHLLVKLDNINKSVGVMTVPMYQIRTDMGRMSHTMHDATGPMKMVNGMFPF
ncbi:MAG: hypothetical protein R3F42_00370 [Pseudomonadota bacterium]